MFDPPIRLAGPGDAGFACHRIPARALSPAGTLLAAWDGRPQNCQDAPQPNSILLRTSTDGATWSAVQVLAAGRPGEPAGPLAKVGYSDPSFVTCPRTGRVFLFCVRSFDWGWHESAVRAPTSPREVMDSVYFTSDDDGATWAGPVSVTAALNPAHDPWSARFATSGAGTTLSTGRLVQQYVIRRAEDRLAYAVSLFSDDDGTTYSEPVPDPHLVDPANNASIIRAFPRTTDPAEAEVLLFSNTDSATTRHRGTVWVSEDSGGTWPHKHVFNPGTTGYSCLAPAPRGRVGLLFEGEESTINFTMFTPAEILPRSTPVPRSGRLSPPGR